MSDRRLRELERLALSGDASALAALERMRERIEPGIRVTTVEAKPRKLRNIWTSAAAQELRELWGADPTVMLIRRMVGELRHARHIAPAQAKRRVRQKQKKRNRQKRKERRR